MNKNQFLQDRDVSVFMDWLSKTLPDITFNLKFAPSRYVPGGLIAQECNFNELLQFYRWQARWTQRDASVVESGDWKSTKDSIAKLKEWLYNTLSENNNTEFLQASSAVLEWGGVLMSRSFLEQKARGGVLVQYMISVRDLLSVGGNKDLNNLTALSIEKFNSGLTKIHAFLDDYGSPIYDSRVGAAIAMFYALYRIETGSAATPLLTFPVGLARGNQARDPAMILNTNAAPKFYTAAVAPYRWAQAQLKLGWIIESLLQRDQDLFKEEGSLASRCHAFEAGMFVIGYDLRCFVEPIDAIHHHGAIINEVVDAQNHGHGWVPTGHPFQHVIAYFYEFLNDGAVHLNVSHAFSEWLVSTGRCNNNNTANAYLFPLKEAEFDLLARDVNTLRIIDQGGRDGLESALGHQAKFSIAEDREHVCLVDAWLTGQAYAQFHNLLDRQDYLINTVHAAGTANAANTLMSVGRGVGLHFDLLNTNTFQPTDYYEEFFKDFQL